MSRAQLGNTSGHMLVFHACLMLAILYYGE